MMIQQRFNENTYKTIVEKITVKQEHWIPTSSAYVLVLTATYRCCLPKCFVPPVHRFYYFSNLDKL